MQGTSLYPHSASCRSMTSLLALGEDLLNFCTQGVPYVRGLGWVDLDIGCLLVFPIQEKLIEVWQKEQGCWARWWVTTQIYSGPRGTPCTSSFSYLVRTASPHVLARLRELQVVHQLRQELHHDPLPGKLVDALEGRAVLSSPSVAEAADGVADHADEGSAFL